jgi:hypothetical protein
MQAQKSIVFSSVSSKMLMLMEETLLLLLFPFLFLASGILGETVVLAGSSRHSLQITGIFTMMLHYKCLTFVLALFLNLTGLASFYEFLQCWGIG